MGSRSISRPPQVHVVEDFLDARDHADILADSVASEAEYQPSSVSVYENNEIIRGRVNPETRIAGSRKLPDRLNKIFKHRIRACEGELASWTGADLPTKYGLEIQAVHSGDGAFFKTHIDTIRGQRASHRVISAVYYYARKPRPFTGGELRLWSLDRTVSTTLEPVDNSIVFFSSMFLHEVMPVAVPSGAFEDGRFSINCWIHRTQ